MFFLSAILYAGNTTIRCPIPYYHMKAEMFTLSKKDHIAETYIKDKNTRFVWNVVITSNDILLNKQTITAFLQHNPNQEFAYEGPGGLGMSRYSCSYIGYPPYDTTFRAYSNGV